MSLVLNTNASWWAYRVSNEECNAPWYPDFNQLLLKPNIPSRHTLSSQTFPTTWDVVKLVNWTPINFWSEDIYAPICFQWDWAWNWIWWTSDLSWSAWTTYSVRFWIPYQMEAWKIIGKEIYWMVAYSSSNNPSAKTFSITVWLLHSDWTISKLPTITKDVPSYGYSSWVVVEYNQSNANWLTTQVWDYVIAELVYSMSVSSENMSFWRWWWRQVQWFSWVWSTANSCRPLPIQISIE